VSRSADARAPAATGHHGRIAGAGRWPRAALAAVAVATLAAGSFMVARAATGTAARHPARSAAGPVRTGTTSSPRPLTRLPIGTIGSYPVARRSLVLVDRSRGRAAGSRVLLTLVRYPVIPAAAAAAGGLARGLFPLVVFAPGYLQCQGSYSSLLRAWASAGYVVAAVEFPRTSCHASGPDEADLVNQPRDMAYVIGRLLAISGRTHGPLSGLVDPADIAVAGHSDGGDTAAAIAANTCCLDHRVAAAIVLAGAEWPPMTGSYFPKGTRPILFVQGSADNINLPADSLMMYRADTAGPRFYLDLFAASHLSPYEGHGSPEPVVARTTTDFLDLYVAGQHSAGAAMRHAGNIAGIAHLVHGGQLPP
jgi:dienelactone hydrolase